jgi:hypothetical protein
MYGVPLDCEQRKSEGPAGRRRVEALGRGDPALDGRPGRDDGENEGSAEAELDALIAYMQSLKKK